MKLVMDYMSDKGYDIYCKHRKKLSHVKSGGIVICIKKIFKNHVEVITSDSKYVLWLRLDKQLFGTQDVLFGSVYLPPEGSSYHNNLCIDSIEHDIVSINCFRHFEVNLYGDFNSQKMFATMYILIELYASKMTLMKSVISDLDGQLGLDRYGIQKQRVSQDKHRCNNMGTKLINVCKSSYLFICNGRVGIDKYHGSLTNMKGKTSQSTANQQYIWSHMVVDMVSKMRCRWLTFRRCFVNRVRYPKIGHFEMHNRLDTCLFDSQNTV